MNAELRVDDVNIKPESIFLASDERFGQAMAYESGTYFMESGSINDELIRDGLLFYMRQKMGNDVLVILGPSTSLVLNDLYQRPVIRDEGFSVWISLEEVK